MAAPGYTIAELQNLQTDSAYYQAHIPSTNIRLKAVQEAAEQLGMQTGLADESEVIDHVLQIHDAQLNQIFNFRLLMYKDSVLPPVIISANNRLHIDNAGDNIRIGGQSYQIIQQVRFVTAPPTWRDYLWMDYPYPAYPNQAVLPKTAEERAVWKEALSKGWGEGIKQAITIYNINLDHLGRDFNGMVLYSKLLAQNMVSPFYVVKHDDGITGDANHVTLDDQTWQITAQPQLQLHSKLWQPVLMSGPTEGGS